MNPQDVQHVVVIGAGVMGHSIAQVFAQAGIEVRLVDLNEKILHRAIHLIGNNLNTLCELGRVQNDEIPGILGRIRPFLDLAPAASGVDFALEAVAEVPDIKRKVFSRLDEICSENTVLASNTSTLDIFDIVHVKRPERLLATHWFAPPHIIPLVEVAPGPHTSSEIVTFTAELMRRLGKKPVVMKQFVPSLIVNRIQNNISLAVWDILQNGWATPEEIDLAVKLSLGVRLPIVGVVQTVDFTGLDLVYDIMQNFGIENTIIREKVERGHLGAKSSRGMYDYGGRSEEEILKKRDTLYIKMLDHLENTTAFQPV
ncbi:MAG: 3-hydroxyacyl-CoA dehydrogenase family protein [Candidatus Abyssobacteria bacterium SURF_17]|jgi:3-hydroxyacyl-CoA dehydrogenase|uniref:3-hydroxyacyl-CoA dehydrogenase family protein n=1 Tax=Candidatus Abyssobacteria bacterium SURF_17 TaxID=2093361 RepID=A0A419F893_9BACT|nr:MAG: 3-hydroxyacyl-CoA dehydrogenase family protein [Candidatus Abyssubacteria bacterium SURF_17]